jgi:hypothetical protein
VKTFLKRTRRSGTKDVLHRKLVITKAGEEINEMADDVKDKLNTIDLKGLDYLP